MWPLLSRTNHWSKLILTENIYFLGGIHCARFGNFQAKGSKILSKWTMLVYRSTDRQVQNTIPQTGAYLNQWHLTDSYSLFQSRKIRSIQIPVYVNNEQKQYFNTCTSQHVGYMYSNMRVTYDKRNHALCYLFTNICSHS